MSFAAASPFHEIYRSILARKVMQAVKENNVEHFTDERHALINTTCVFITCRCR